MKGIANKELKEFLSRYAPDTQIANTSDIAMCVMGDALTLSQLDGTYGKNASSLWLVPQLTDLSEFCNVQNSLSERHIVQLAQLISAEYFYLKITELMLFFRRMKTGSYGKVYGTVSPIDIMVALKQFVKERNEVMNEAETKQRELQLEEWSQSAITYEEYMKNKLLTKSYNNESD